MQPDQSQPNASLAKELTQDESDLFYNTLFRITDGLPAHELQSIAKEAANCETALQKEIELLEASIAASDAAAGENKDNDVNTKSAPGTTDAGNPSLIPKAPSAPIPTHSPIPIIPPEYDASNINQSTKNYLPTTQQIMQTELSPLDRYFTVSALLGRLREPFDTPPPPHSGLARARAAANAALERKHKKNKSNLSAQQVRTNQSLDKYSNISKLRDLNEIYTGRSADGDENGIGYTYGYNNQIALLALVKRISNHRTATVFRRAVDPKEAPGYISRILFPIDLTLIKKMVICGYIRTFEQLHQNIGLICHNCVKFNGRDSDYTLLTRDFEGYVDDSFLDFLYKQKEKALVAKAAEDASAAVVAKAAAASTAAEGNGTGSGAKANNGGGNVSGASTTTT